MIRGYMEAVNHHPPVVKRRKQHDNAEHFAVFHRTVDDVRSAQNLPRLRASGQSSVNVSGTSCSRPSIRRYTCVTS